MKCLCAILLLLVCCSCYDSVDAPTTAQPPAPAVTTTLSELRGLYTGKTFVVESDVVVDGRVTSHDRASNFYRTFTIEHQGTAVEVMAGIDGLHNIYPLGNMVTLSLKGLAVGESHGTLQIGRMPAAGSSYPTDYIGSRAALDRHIFRSDDHQKPKALIVPLDSLTPSMAGRLVRIDDVHYTPQEQEPNEWAGTRRFIDFEGRELYTYTRAYADFSAHAIPSASLVLFGILQCDGTNSTTPRYTLRLRDEKDCWY